MEDPQINKIKNLIKHELRQSDGWQEYLEWLGWETKKTDKGIKIYFRKTPFGKVSKVQRPDILNEDDLKEIEEICRKNRAMFIKIEPEINQPMDLLKRYGYFESRYPLLTSATIFMDLKQSEEELWENVSHSGKYSIRRAQREGAQVEFYNKPGTKELEIFQQLTQDTEDARGFKATILEDLKKKVSIFGKDSWVVLVKNNKGKYTVGSFYLAYKNNVWFMHGGTSDEGRGGKEGYELMWRSILYFKEQGFDAIDLEGIYDERFHHFTLKWKGFGDFKAKFGGTNVYYPEPQLKLLSPVLKVLSKMYRTLPL